MKLLVTGADGFTGKHFCHHARSAGYEVIKLKSNLLDFDSVKDEVFSSMPNYVVHLAAISFVGSSDKSSFYSVNVVGTTNLLDAISQLPIMPMKVLIASSANVYGNCKVSPIDETVIPNPTNHYAMSKLAMEKMTFTYRNTIDFVITRPFNYTGPGQNINFVIPKIVDSFIKNKPSISLGNTYIEREFNDIAMVCQSYLILLTNGASGEIYNICSGNAYSLQSVINMLTSITGHSIQINTDPKFIRSNEVELLKGSPLKLHKLIRDTSANLEKVNLESTLKSMLDEGL